MFVTAFTSAQGGVGKTSVAANLGAILAARGLPVLVMEWDPANRLAFFLGLPEPPEQGWIRPAAAGAAWPGTALENSDRVQFLPYGNVPGVERMPFEAMIASDASWLARQLRSLDLDADTHVLLDVLRGPSVYLDQALVAADLVIAILTPSPAFALDIAVLEAAGRRTATADSTVSDMFFLLNQLDTTRRLQRDVLVILRADLEQQLLPYVVHRDDAFPEAIAANVSLADYAPDSQAGHDLQGLASWLAAYAVQRGTERRP